MAVIVDGVLQEWGERMFYRTPRKGRRCITVTGTKIVKVSTSEATVRSPRVLKSAIRAASRKAPALQVSEVACDQKQISRNDRRFFAEAPG